MLRKEDLLAIILDRKPSLESPYGLYGHPPMWDLYTKDGITTAIRPARTMERINFTYVETDGICWGRHENGVWIPGEQHYSGSFSYFLESVANPAIADGAVLVKVTEGTAMDMMSSAP